MLGGVVAVVRRVLILLALIASALVLAAFAFVASGFRAQAPLRLRPPSPPREVGVSFNFLGGPNLVFLCWTHEGQDVKFYDVQVRAFNNGQPREEVRYGVTTSECSGATGNGQYMWSPDLYHYAVRACNNAGCSAWADASEGDSYWHQVPCTDPSGAACARQE